MQTEETRIQLARQGAQLEEIAKNVARLVDLSENLARMQERESERDEKIRLLFRKADCMSDEGRKLDIRLTSSTAWARGVMAVLTAIILPVSGAVLWEVLHDIPAIERRVQALEIEQTVKTGGK